MFILYNPIIQYPGVFSQFAINAGGILSCFPELYFHAGMVFSCYEAVLSLFCVQKGRAENITLLSALPVLRSAIYVFPVMCRTLFHIIQGVHRLILVFQLKEYIDAFHGIILGRL